MIKKLVLLLLGAVLCLLIISPALSFEAPTKGKARASPTVDSDLRDREKERERERDREREREDDGILIYTLEHSIDQTTFSQRATVEINYGSRGAVRFGELPPNTNDVPAFKKLVQDAGYYRIRVGSEPISSSPSSSLSSIAASSNNNQTQFVVAYVPACGLLASSFREQIIFHADVYGNIISLDYRIPVTNCHPPLNNKVTKLEFHPKGRLSLGRAGEKMKNIRMTSSVGSVSSQSSVEGGSGSGSEEADKKAAAAGGGSFWSKYWMYIVPFGIFLIMQNLAPQQGQQGQQRASS